VFSAQTSAEQPSWDHLAARPEVEQIARWRLVFGLIGEEYSVMFAPSDDVWLQQVDRPIVVAGRMFDPKAADEVVVSDDQNGVDGPPVVVGDTIPLDLFGPYDPAVGDVPGSGPSVQLHVVGVIHASFSYEFTSGIFMSPAFISTYGNQIEFAENAMVKLRHGTDDVVALRRDSNTDIFPGVPVLDFQTTARRVTATTDVEKAMLVLLATIIALAGLVFIGQALARSAASVGADAGTLRALGMSRRDLMAAGVRPHLLVAGVAAVTTIATATVASRWFPVGLAAGVDPDRGVRVDVPLLVSAAAACALLVLGEAALASWLAAGPDARRRGARPSLLARLGLVRPLTLGVGVRMALESGRRAGRSRGNSRSALVGALAAVAGIVAIVTLDHGLNESLRHPEVAGVAWDATVAPTQSHVSVQGVDPSIVDEVLAQPGLAATATIGRVVVQIGDVGVPAFTVIDRGTGAHLRLVTLSGRAPQTDDEIELGPSTARDLDAHIGSTITLADGRPATVVGLGLFPTDVHAQFDEGAWVSNDRWFDLLGTQDPDTEGAEFAIAIRFSDRSHLNEQTMALWQALDGQVDDVAPAELPMELTNLHNIRRLPTVLAIFLTVLGVVAVGHALFSSVRRRRKDFAIMRSLGITRPGTRLILAAQGSVVAIVGLIGGVPLGLIAGRSGWQAITDRVPLTFRSPITFFALVLVVPVAIVTANALSVLPGRRAARLDPAIVLRSE
jgi:ABC-type lipoprotein release transport system permease subunit